MVNHGDNQAASIRRDAEPVHHGEASFCAIVPGVLVPQPDGVVIASRYNSRTLEERGNTVHVHSTQERRPSGKLPFARQQDLLASTLVIGFINPWRAHGTRRLRRVVNTTEPPWEERYSEKLGRSILRKDLYTDPETGAEVRLVRYPAGLVQSAPHPSVLGMALYVLEGKPVTHKGLRPARERSSGFRRAKSWSMQGHSRIGCHGAFYNKQELPY